MGNLFSSKPIQYHGGKDTKTTIINHAENNNTTSIREIPSNVSKQINHDKQNMKLFENTDNIDKNNMVVKDIPRHDIVVNPNAQMLQLFCDLPPPPPKQKPSPPRRMFGHFQCEKCKKKWTSSHAWENKGQECTRCHINVLPSELYPLQPTFEYVFKCSNSNCNMTNIKCITKDININTEVRKKFVTPFEFECTENHKSYKKQPFKMTFSFTNAYCYAKCNHCEKQHKIHDFHIDKKDLTNVDNICSACHKMCILQQINRIESDITKPHRRDLCEMCKSLNRYCGR